MINGNFRSKKPKELGRTLPFIPYACFGHMFWTFVPMLSNRSIFYLKAICMLTPFMSFRDRDSWSLSIIYQNALTQHTHTNTHISPVYWPHANVPSIFIFNNTANELLTYTYVSYIYIVSKCMFILKFTWIRVLWEFVIILIVFFCFYYFVCMLLLLFRHQRTYIIYFGTIQIASASCMLVKCNA